MYYHSRELEFVSYGKVYGNPDPDPDWGIAYRWLGNYCGFFPQVWLSRNCSEMTGYRHDKDSILFGFDVIKGFPVDYSWWGSVMNDCINTALQTGKDPVADKDFFDQRIRENSERFIAEIVLEYGDDDPFWKPSSSPKAFESYLEWLHNVVFVKHNQVVLPSLNLKAAKEVVCRNEKQKKKLRKMGFIEDRIKIRNTHVERWW